MGDALHESEGKAWGDRCTADLEHGTEGSDMERLKNSLKNKSRTDRSPDTFPWGKMN